MAATPSDSYAADDELLDETEIEIEAEIEPDSDQPAPPQPSPPAPPARPSFSPPARPQFPSAGATMAFPGVLALTDDHGKGALDEQSRIIRKLPLDHLPVVETARAHSPQLATPTPIDFGAPSGGSRRPPPPREGAAPSLPPPPPKTRTLAARVEEGSETRPGLVRTSVDEDPLENLRALLLARLAVLEKAGDRVGQARAYCELSVVVQLLDEPGRANQYADAALAIDPNLRVAHWFKRLRAHGRGELGAMLSHLMREIEVGGDDPLTTALVAEQARLLDGAATDPTVVRSAWERVLSREPVHAAALRGLEGELVGATSSGSESSHEALVAHLGKLADAYGSQPTLSAWLHVERARLLEKNLGRDEDARAALERAVVLDPSVGPVRSALSLHLATIDDAAALLERFDEESLLELSPARSAQLELDAALLASVRLDDPLRATALLERAATRAPTTEPVDRRVLDELIGHYERAGRWLDVVKTRQARLAYLHDVDVQKFELQRIAALCEKIGDLSAAIQFLFAAYQIEPHDSKLVEQLDRLLALAEQDPERLRLWLDEAARHEGQPRAADSLRRAAQIAEQMDERASALRHLENALRLRPDDAETVDLLARLMAPAPSPELAMEARSLLELYARAAQATLDVDRRIAYHERAALLWEDVLGDPRRALRTYQDILELQPGRRSAVLGLARNAARLGDSRGTAQALLAEADQAADVRSARDLRVRAATALEHVDPERAARLVRDVLSEAPEHDGARALECRMHENAGRYAQAAQSLRTRIAHTQDAHANVRYYLALAHIEEASLGSPNKALEALRAARELDPEHLAPPEEIARLLGQLGDLHALRTAYEELAATAVRPEDRARFLLHAAELEEFRSGDDVQAARLYVQALVETPDDDWVADRLERVLARKAKRAHVRERGSTRAPTVGLGERITLLGQQLQRCEDPERQLALRFQLAELLIDLGQDHPRALSLLEEVLAERDDHVPALRTLENLARKQLAWAQLARVLSKQGAALLDVRARIGALWSLATIQEWHLSGTSSYETYERILLLDPTDHGALEAVVRYKSAPARAGDGHARGAVLTALRAFAGVANEDSTRLLLELQLALSLEFWGTGNVELQHEALERYASALTLDNASVGAATGLARASSALGDVARAVDAALALAELSRPQHETRAHYLTDAALLLIAGSGTNHNALGTPETRRKRAAALLEEALLVDPNSTEAAAVLTRLRREQREYDPLQATLRDALSRASHADAVRALGTEIALLARDHLDNPTLAIEALRKVRQAQPNHAGSLLLLADVHVQRRQFGDAIEVLESVAKLSDEAPSQMIALFTLGRIYEQHAVDRPAAERVLRKALELEPQSARALRSLLHRLASKNGEPQEGAAKDHRREMADLLERLAAVEADDYAKADVLLELAELRQHLDELGAAEGALIEAAARAPLNDQTLQRMRAFYRIDQPGEQGAEYAQAVAAVLKRGHELGHTEARWFAELGNVEIDKLGRVRDGINHLTQAIRQNRDLYSTRFQLANALARSGSNDEAARALLEMIVPDAKALLGLPQPGQALDLLERVLGAERRPEEAIAVSELRAILGDLDDARHRWLRKRELATFEHHHSGLDRSALLAHVAPRETQHVLLEVAAALSGTEAKMLRSDLTEIGISSRDRISSRSGHPTRVLLDRLCRALGLSDVELVVTPNVSRTRVFVQDEPWIVAPKRLTELPEQSQLASLARALAKVALCVPWLEELPPAHIEAYLLAAARQAFPRYGEHHVDVISMRLVTQYEPALAKALARRNRRALEELAPRLAQPEQAPIPFEELLRGLARTELRAAYVLTGDLLSTVDELRALDPAFLAQTETPGSGALQAVFEHPYAGDVARFALTREAAALRRRVASVWSG